MINQNEEGGIIYVATNKINGKKYVGQTIRTFKRRLYGHMKSDSPFGRALRKYGPESFAIKEYENIRIDWLDWAEIELIAKYKSFVPHGYNVMLGGQLSREWLVHPNIGKKHNEQSRLNMSLAHVGKPNNQLGKKRSDESRKRMSDARKGKGLPYHRQDKKVICIETGEIFNSIKEAEAAYKIHGISRVCKVHTATAGGFHWRHYEGIKK